MRSLNILIIFFFSNSIFAQNIIPELGEVFSDQEVPKIYLTINPDSLEAVLDHENYDKDHLFPATFRFVNSNIDETENDVGIRLRGNSSLISAKKSFKISFNSFGQVRQWRGLEKMNLNGEHNDPSIARSKIVWDMCRMMGLPGSRANHIELYVNNEYFGLYMNIEHIDEEFTQLRYQNNDGNLYKCFYGADLDYMGSDPDGYKHSPFGNRVYELKNNTKLDDYSDLAELIITLNNTSIGNLACELEKVFNVDDWLKYLVIHVLSGHWDDPILNKNNYYLYHNLSTGKMEYILYDVDNTLGVDFIGFDLANRSVANWGNFSVDNPLYHKILLVSEYRDKYYYYLDKALDEFFNPTFMDTYLNNLRDRIAPSVVNDPFHELDYGYTYNEFLDAFDQPLDYWFVERSLKDYIFTRHDTARDQLPSFDIKPSLNFAKVNFLSGVENFPVRIKVETESVAEVKFCIRSDNMQNPVCHDLFDDGNHQDELPGDNIYGAIQLISVADAGTHLFYFTASDNSGNSTRYPRCNDGILYAHENPLGLVINEINPQNTSGIADENGQFEDWIELFNRSNSNAETKTLFLSDRFMTPAKWPLPDQNINDGSYQIVWADNDAEEGIWHSNFKLSSAGESVFLFEENEGMFSLIDYVLFDQIASDKSYARIPNGTGAFESRDPTPGFNNESSGIENAENEFNFSMFPNPCTGDKIYFKVNTGTYKGENLKLTLSNSLGQQLLEKSYFNFPNELLLPSLSSGLYFLGLEKEGQTWVQKIIVQ